MKLITFSFIITSLAVYTKCQRIQQDQFPFPPQFQTPSSGIMVSDSSIYLPPEPHTPIPYFAMNHMNKLPFQFLPPSGTKAPSVYPTPFSGIFSSTMRPHFEDDDEDEEDQVSQIRITSPRSVMNHNSQVKMNMSESNSEKRETRALPKMFQFQQKPQSRVDTKQPQSFQPVSTQGPQQSNSASRRMILTSEIQRNDISDHLKSHSGPYSQLPNLFFSSTTEPAIPILRLSNEMDLDGSFSYEALGADQTHYVQHSRMENMGTDKEEQVVEGSYSYVGDNGQTYTVHYVADSNGYRASGEHLPSPPPIPEIIQRAIQYNLAEEARRPPHMKASWEDNASENDNNIADKTSRFSGTPTRLFTGRTPEAFSFGFAQNSNSQNNLAATSASSLIPKTNFDIAVELSKSKTNGPIGPQITFSATQGAHNPSSSLQQSVSRSSTNEKPSMPQIMNYEASSAREIEPETKPLWRWQYGMNTNNDQQNQQNHNKNTISRSFGEGDDVIINFSDMTPEQYTDMIRSQVLEENSNEGREYDNNYFKNNFVQSTPNSLNTDNIQYVYNTYNNNNNYPSQENMNSELKNNNNLEIDPGMNNNQHYSPPNEVSSTTQIPNSMQNFKNYNEEVKILPKSNIANPHPNIIRQQNFLPPSLQVTQSYDYEDTSYEPRKVTKPMNSYSTPLEENVHNQVNVSPSTAYWYTSEETSQTTTVAPYLSTMVEIKPTQYTPKDVNNNFRPITHLKDLNNQESTTEKNMEELIQENIFLKNIVRSKKEENTQQTNTEPKTEVKNNSNVEQRDDKISKHVHFYPKPQNEIKTIKKKPLDITDVLNYIAMKNHLDLSKTKPRSKPTFGNYQQNRDTPVNFIPLEEEKQESIREREERNNSYRTLNQQEEELQGIIKNYKVLQRQRNTAQNNNQYSDVPQKHVKIFHSQSLPPLGRAGPSMKSYLPPSYL